MDDDMKRTTNRLNHYLGRPSSRQDMKAMSAPNHGKSSLVGADGQLVTAIHQQESTHNQPWIRHEDVYLHQPALTHINSLTPHTPALING